MEKNPAPLGMYKTIIPGGCLGIPSINSYEKLSVSSYSSFFRSSWDPGGRAISLWDLPVRRVQWRSMRCPCCSRFLSEGDVKFPRATSTVDGNQKSGGWKPPGMYKSFVNDGINDLSLNWLAGFLNQQYFGVATYFVYIKEIFSPRGHLVGWCVHGKWTHYRFIVIFIDYLLVPFVLGVFLWQENWPLMKLCMIFQEAWILWDLMSLAPGILNSNQDDLRFKCKRSHWIWVSDSSSEKKTCNWESLPPPRDAGFFCK